MISVCPECKRSYPTHHGPICRLCAAKKIKENSDNKATEQPKSSEQSKLAPSVKPETKGNPASNLQQPQKTNQLPNLLTYSDPSGTAQISVEGGMDQLECPHCSYLNKSSDIFCSSCKKMIKTSIGAKNKDYKINEIKNIASTQLSQFKKLGIETTLQILDKGLNPTKRKTLTMKTAIPEILLLRIVNQADLLRIPNIEPEQAFLLECVGVNSIKSLEKQVPDKLMDTITKNKSMLTSKTIYILPDKKLVTQWIDDAKKIEKLVS